MKLVIEPVVFVNGLVALVITATIPELNRIGFKLDPPIEATPFAGRGTAASGVTTPSVGTTVVFKMIKNPDVALKLTA
jgi:hypothetical protein